LGQRICREAVEQFLRLEQEEMHAVVCYVRLWEYGQAAGFPEGADWNALELKLEQQIGLCLEKDYSKWATGYVCRPSHFLNSPKSRFYPAIKEWADAECGVIRSTRLADGSWPVVWSWGAYPEEWSVSRTWWKSVKALESLLDLRHFSRL
jgi:hypothetical protein